MSFDPEKVHEFETLFQSVKSKIAAFEGCEGLLLLRDAEANHVFFTYSYWQSEWHLNNYRYSELFEHTWSATKKLFNDKPMAWSCIVSEKVK